MTRRRLSLVKLIPLAMHVAAVRLRRPAQLIRDGALARPRATAPIDIATAQRPSAAECAESSQGATAVSYGHRMPISSAVRDDALRDVSRFCDDRVPDGMRDQIRVEHSIRGNSITIVERRPPWSEHAGPDWTSVKVAQLRYDERSRTWSLYAADRNSRWFLYDEVGPEASVVPLLAEIASDPTGIFWG
jgi:Protein of unknown function (DUF3024)